MMSNLCHAPLPHVHTAADGQRIYLSSLNVRCLVHPFGSMEKCPDEVVGPVLELEELSVTEETRKRFRHMGHLPLSTEFSIAELDLSKVLSPECLAHFAGMLLGLACACWRL